MNYYNEIKKELIDNELTKKAKDYSKNKSDLEHYYNVGKLIVEAQGGINKVNYGNKLIKEYALKLTNELGKGYSWRSLYNMRLYYIKFNDNNLILSAMRAKLLWNHYKVLLSIKDDYEIVYYIKISYEQSLSYRQLHQKIKLNEYGRLDNKTKEKLIQKEEMVVTDFIKNPIIIKNSLNIQDISEKYLKKLILEDLDHFLKELGDGFSYLANEYKIKISNSYNYIDLLLFNIKYNCYCVIELKVVPLSKEHLGQVMLYMNYVDKNIKSIYHDKTIGIIICKHDNKLVLEYCSDPRIFSVEYELV